MPCVYVYLAHTRDKASLARLTKCSRFLSRNVPYLTPVALHQYQVKILTVQEQIQELQKQIQAAAAAARAPQKPGAAARGTKRSAEERDAEKAQRAAEKVSHPSASDPSTCTGASYQRERYPFERHL